MSPPRIGEELRHLPHTPSSSASRRRAGRRRALGLDRGGDCHVYGTSIWRSSVSRADEIGGRRRLSLAIVARLYEPAGKAASRGQRPGLRLRPAAGCPRFPGVSFCPTRYSRVPILAEKLAFVFQLRRTGGIRSSGSHISDLCTPAAAARKRRSRLVHCPISRLHFHLH